MLHPFLVKKGMAIIAESKRLCRRQYSILREVYLSFSHPIVYSQIPILQELLAPPTLDDLVRVTGVLLQKLDEPCSDEHLITISSDLTQWRAVAPYLGLKEGDIEEIETDARTESQKRSKVLRKWKNKYSFMATYRVLTEVLLKCHMADRAEKVCHLLSADPQVPRDDSVPVHDENTSSATVYVESNIPTTAALVTMADGIQTDLLSVARKAFQEKVTGVPLQKLDEPCSDEHLITISSDLTQWRAVAPYLGLKEGDIEEIETDARTESQKRSKVLRKWKDKYSSKATYRVLMEALLKCHMADRAEKVCHLLSADPQVPRDDSVPVHDENTSSATVYVESNIPTTAALVTMADGIQTDLLSVARKAFQEKVTGVPLQKLDEPCSDEHLITISSDLTQWRAVAPYLGLKEGDIEEIETDARTESQKRSKVLRKWKDKYSSKATYRVLMEALLKCHMADRAEKVCHLLSADPQEPRDSKPVHDENTSSVYVESNIPTTAALVTMAQLKCTVVQERFDQLADGIQTDLLSVARKAFQEKVIPHAKLKVVQNEGISEDSRATTLISAILDQIRQNERVYDTFLSILRAVPAIRWLADNLSKHLQKLQKASNSASGTCTSAASITTSHEPGVSGQEDGDSNKKILRQELDSGVNLPWGRGQELSSVAQELNFTGRIQNSQLVVQSAMSSHYQAVRTLFGVLVTGIQDDVDHLITKAYSCNPRPLIGKDQVDMQQGVSKAQKARSFLGSLLNRIETDPSGESYEIFLKVLSSEEHLVYLAKQIKDEVLRLRISADEHSTGIPRNDRPDGASPFPHSTPTAGDASFGMPKLERREKSVSGIEVTFSLQDVESDEDSQVELAPRSLHRVGRVSSLTDFQQVTPGVVALRDEEDENIPIEESHRDQQAVTDTQEPGADATVNPIVVGDSTDSSINRAHEGLREVVGSAIATLRKEKDDLRSELAESEESERKKDELVQELRQKKNRSEQQLLCKKQELEKIKKEKKSEIDNLKSQLQKKDKVVEMYKEQVAMKKLEKEEEIENRQKWEDRIKALEAQNETVHEKYGKIKETYEDKIRQLEETVKAAEEQKSKAELLKAQIEVQLAQKGKERTEIVLTKEIVIHQLEIQLLKLERELARAEQRKQQNTIAERDATITELRKEILSIKTGDEKPPSENQSKKRTETEPGMSGHVYLHLVIFFILAELKVVKECGYIFLLYTGHMTLIFINWVLVY